MTARSALTRRFGPIAARTIPLVAASVIGKCHRHDERSHTREQFHARRIGIVVLVALIVAWAFGGAIASAVAATNSSGRRSVGECLMSRRSGRRSFPAVYGIDYEAIPPDRLARTARPTRLQLVVAAARRPTRTSPTTRSTAPPVTFLAWDAQGLIPTIQKQFGDFAVALVGRRRGFGHTIQERTGTSAGSTIPSSSKPTARGRLGATRDDHDRRHLQRQEGGPRPGPDGYLYFRRPHGYRPHE